MNRKAWAILILGIAVATAIGVIRWRALEARMEISDRRAATYFSMMDYMLRQSAYEHGALLEAVRYWASQQGADSLLGDPNPPDSSALAGPPRVAVAGGWYLWRGGQCHLSTRRDPDDGQWVRDCPVLYPLEIRADSVVVMVDNEQLGGTPCPTGAILTIPRADWDAMPEDLALRDPDLAGLK